MVEKRDFDLLAVIFAGLLAEISGAEPVAVVSAPTALIPGAEPEKAPERLVTILPKNRPAKAALGQHKTADGGAQKGETGKAETQVSEVKASVAETPVEYTVSPTGEISINKDEIARLIKDLESQMKGASKLLEFEKAAAFRDRIVELRRTLALEV